MHFQLVGAIKHRLMPSRDLIWADYDDDDLNRLTYVIVTGKVSEECTPTLYLPLHLALQPNNVFLVSLTTLTHISSFTFWTVFYRVRTFKPTFLFMPVFLPDPSVSEVA